MSPSNSNGSMSTLVHAAEELVKAACSHVESISLNATKDSIETLKDIALQSSSSMETSIRVMKEILTENSDTIKQSLADNADSNKQNLDLIKQVDTKLTTLNSHMISMKDELANLSKTLEKQATVQRLQWAVANFNDISQPFTYFSYEIQGKSLDFTKSSSSTIIREILLAFLRGEGCDISCRTMNKKNRDEGEKEFRETISKEIQAITGQKPRISVAEKGYAIYYS
jgi:hypothetical protein